MKTVDMHCDTISALLAKKRAGEVVSLKDCDCHINLKKLKQGDYLLQNFALFVNLGNCVEPWQEVQELFELYTQLLLENRETIAPVLAFDDIEKNRKAGKMSAMLTVEEGGVCGGSLEKLETLYRQGVRMMTLTWNYPNELGYPNLDTGKGLRIKMASQGGNSAVVNLVTKNYLNTPNETDGLTETGKTFVEKMEELGMIVDVSHMSDAGFWDVLAHTKKPFVASHSNARAICPCVRNLSDKMIRALAERGGVMGLNFCADFLTQVPTGTKNPGTIEEVVSHARYIAAVGGVECIGLGSDFDGIDTHEELPGADAMGRLWDALKKGGFTESEVDRIFGENVLRLYRDII